MTEPMSDALFGVDGTELPRLSSDPTGRSSWGDLPLPLPVPLPSIPNLSMTPEAIAAALGEDPGRPMTQEPAAAPAAAAPTAAAPTAAVPAAAAPNAPQATVTTSPPLPRPAAAPPSHSAVRRQPQPIVSPVSSPQPSREWGSGRSKSARSRPRVQLRSSRRRVVRQALGLPTQTRSNGGAGAFFVIAVIVFAVLLYFIISGIAESFASLIP